jgi:predicted TPR repeat methyltransferase
MKNIDPRTQWKWKLPNAELVNDHEFYCNLAQGKKVLHIGCTDHKELIDIKISQHSFLHINLMKYAKVLHGIDINQEAIEYLRIKYDITNICYCDITQNSFPDILLPSYDIILVPEVIEHILDLGSFLIAVKRFMSSESLLVIGTPNACRLHSLFTVFKGYEEVNPDHKYYFSYSTLKSSLQDLGLVIDKWHIYIYGNPRRRFFKYGVSSIVALLKGLAIEVNPWYGDGIIVEARLSSS